MRNVRACATDGARLTPSAPSAPRAADTPPESLTKSRRVRPPAGLDAAVAAGGGTDAAIRPKSPSWDAGFQGVGDVPVIWGYCAPSRTQLHRPTARPPTRGRVACAVGPAVVGSSATRRCGADPVRPNFYTRSGRVGEVGGERRVLRSPPIGSPDLPRRRSLMFKKSEEQEGTRFRGALSKDRDETGAASTVPDPSDTSASGMSASSAAQGAGPSFRSSASDVNVGLPTTRTIARGSDGVEAESLIGERSNFEGTLKTEGPVRLLGSIQGEIESKSTIYVEEKAHVTARLTGAHVTVAGQVDGQIFCEGRVEIRPTGRVTGEINAGALIVQEGAYFEGNSRMATHGHPSPTSTSTSAPATTSGSAAAAPTTATPSAASQAGRAPDS